MSRVWAGLLTVFALALCTPRADASVLFSSTASGLSASASFSISGTTLTILLTNTDTATGAGAPTDPANVLTGLFFNLGSGAFTPVTAKLPTGSSIIQTDQCSVTCAGEKNVGGEFSYAYGGADWLAGTNQGIASSGYLNANTGSGNFPGGTNWDDPAALDGINFGIVPDGWTAYSGNGGLDGVPLIEGAVKFVLTVPPGLNESDIKNVYFTYGTSKNEGTLGGTTSGVPSTITSATVPEPGILSLVGLALTGIGVRLRRRSS